MAVMQDPVVGGATTPLAAAEPSVLALAVSLASSLDPGETRAHILSGAATILDADRTILVEARDPGIGVLATHARRGPPDDDGPELDGWLLSDVVGQALRAGTPVVRDVRRLRVVAPSEDADATSPRRSILAIPFTMDGDGLRGALVAVRRSPYPYSEADTHAACALAALVDCSLRNAELHDRTLRAERAVRGLEQVKSDFLRLASHELRAPLGVLGGYLDMLRDGTLGSLPPAAAGVVPIASRKVAEMNNLVDEMLETARLEDSRLSLSRTVCDLRDVAAHAAGLRRDVGDRLDLVLPAGRVDVFVDRARIEIVVANLVDNAAKYSPAEEPIRCVVSADGATARLAVVDRGPGIAEADTPRLFTRFGRIVTPETAHVPGTGLGLYLAREIARRHDGDVTLESRFGQGSTFTLALPVHADPRDP